MKTSINQWAFPGDMPTTEAISLAKQVGFEAFEVCVAEKGTLPLATTEAEATAVRRHADSLGIEVCTVGSGSGWQYPIGSPDKATSEKGKEILERALTLAGWLGADAVLVVPGVVSAAASYDVVLERTLSAVQDLTPIAEKRKVSLAFENVWNKFLLSPVEMRDFIDHFESEFVGAYFDVGNILPYGYPEQWIRILGDRLRAIHVKDFREAVGNINGFVMLLEGDVNWPAVMTALREVGFDGALTAEYGGYAHSREAMLKHVLASLQTIIGL